VKIPSFTRHESAAAIAIIVVVVAASYWKLATMQGVLITDDIFTSDMMNDEFPYRFYLGQVLKGGELPLWYPPVYGGFPLLARAEAGICYPPNILLFWLLDPYVALNAVILLTLLTAGVGMYFYAREIGAGLHGSLLAGFAFAYSGFIVSHLKHLSMVNCACWFPLGLLAIERALGDGRAGPGERRTRVRALLWLGVVFSLQNLSGHIQIAYYSALAYGAYYVARMYAIWRAQKAGPRSLRPLLREGLAAWFVAAMGAGALIGAVQILPTYELVQRSQRSGGVTFDYATQYNYDLASFWTFFYPPVHGEPGHASYTGSGIFWEDYGYVGFVTIILAAFALFRKFRSWHVRFFAVAAVLAYLMVLGKSTPAFGIAFDIVPMMRFFRFPTRLLFIVDASLAVMAGIGLRHLLTSPGNVQRTAKGAGFAAVAASVILCIAVVDLIFFQLRQNAIAPLGDWKKPPRTAAVLEGEARAFRIYSQGADFTHIAAYNNAMGWLGSLQPYIDQREFLQPSLPVLYGFSTPNGYAQLTPTYVVDIWGDQNRSGLWNSLAGLTRGHFEVRPPYKKLLSLHNVKTILSPLPIVGEPFVFRGMVGQVRLYDNPDVLPRAFVVGAYRIAADEKQSVSLLAAADFRPAREAILFEKPGIIPHDSINASATIVSYRTNEVNVETRASEQGILILSDTYYPGWEAEVDGSAAALLRANHTMRAVVVPAGSHSVRFLFRPQSVRLGFLLTVAGIGAMALMMAVPGRKEK
jgi:hypothetical protein